MDAEQLKLILTIVSTVASFLFVTLIPSVILLIKKWKEYKNAKTGAEKEAILNEISTACVDFIKNAEEAFKPLDQAMKKENPNNGCGAVKKRDVLTQVQALCMQKGLEYDSKYWSDKVDELVEMTKKVNTKTN